MKKTLIVIVAILLMTVNITIPAQAYVGETDLNRVETWKQWQFPLDNSLILKPGGYKFSSASCGYFALTTIVHKIGSENKNFTPVDLLERVYEKKAWNNAWGHLDFGRIEELDLGLKIVDKNNLFGLRKRTQTYSWGISHLPIEQQEEVIGKLWGDGYHILICARTPTGGGHYVAVDYVTEDGRIRITDSAYPCSWWDEFYGAKELPMSYIVVLETINENVEINYIYSNDLESQESDENEVDQAYLDFLKNLEEENIESLEYYSNLVSTH